MEFNGTADYVDLSLEEIKSLYQDHFRGFRYRGTGQEFNEGDEPEPDFVRE